MGRSNQRRVSYELKKIHISCSNSNHIDFHGGGGYNLNEVYASDTSHAVAFSGAGETVASYIGTGQYCSNRLANIEVKLKSGKPFNNFLKLENNRWVEETSGSTSASGMDIKHADRVVREKNYAVSTSYDIHIDLDGGEGIDVLDYTYTVNDDIIINTHPTKVGYTFIGWTGTDIEVPQMEINIEKGTTVGDKTFTANWRRMQLRVVTPTDENSTLVRMIKVYDVDSEGKYVLKQTINHSTNLRSNDLTDIMSYTGIDKTFTAYPGGWVELYLKQEVEVAVVGDVKRTEYKGIYRKNSEYRNPNVIKFKIPEDAYEDNAISTHFRHYQGRLIGETIYAGNRYSDTYPESGLWYANKDILGLVTLSHDGGTSWVIGQGEYNQVVVCDFYGNTL